MMPRLVGREFHWAGSENQPEQINAFLNFAFEIPLIWVGRIFNPENVFK
jgi:hypothetical protein